MSGGLPSYEEVVEAALDVFKQYDTALTLRQLYYRLVSRHLFENTINNYKRLSRIMVKAREEGDVPVNCLEDRSRRILGRGDADYISAKDFLRRRISGLKESYKEFRMPMWDDQPFYLLISLEKDALSRLVSDEANKYHIRTFPTRGYPSFSYVRRMASYIRNRLKGKPTVVLYFGDLDPSGMDIERDLSERLQKYGAGDFKVRRIALTRDQILQYSLPPMPVKKSDARTPSFVANFGEETVELDALDPNMLKLLVHRSVEEHIDLATWKRKEDEIARLRLWIKRKLKDIESLIEV